MKLRPQAWMTLVLFRPLVRGTASLAALALMSSALVLLAPGSASAAPGDIEWFRQFGGAGPAFDSASAVDGDGNVYVAGSTEGTMPGQTSAGRRDAFVRKYDASGTEVWTRQFGTSIFDQVLGVSVDASGVYVAGSTDGTLPGQTSAGRRDAFVRKYDASGTEVWTRQFGTSSFDEVFGVSVDASGVYVAGMAGGTLPGQTSVGSGDAFVRAYDASGAEVWTRQFGTSSFDHASGVSVDASGVYVAGLTDGTLPGQTSAGFRDAFVRKYDASGTEVWTRQFGTSSFDHASGVSVDASGVYVAGETSGTLPGQTSAGSGDAFVRAYDASGTEVWTRQFGTSSSDQALGVSVDASGVYVAGLTGGTLPGQTSAGSRDAFVRKYDASGTEVWTRQFGSSTFDHASGVSVDASGVYVAGTTFGSLPGQSSAGGVDVFVRKYDAAGTEVWTRQFGSAGPVTDVASAVDGGGNVYVAGSTEGTLPGQTNAGFRDAFVRKYDASGTEVWTRQFGTSSRDEALGVSVDASGVYVAGVTCGTLPGQTGAGSCDAFMRKYDASGTEVWTRQFGTSSGDQVLGVSVDASGVYVAGLTDGTLPGQASAGSGDAFVRKYDASGTEVWTRQFGTSRPDLVRGVGVGGDGNVYVAGSTGGTLPGQTSAGDIDAFVRVYDASGTEVWTRQFGSSTSDHAQGVSVDASGVYVAGLTFGTLPGQTSAGSGDAFVRKYDASGTEVWTRQFGTSSFDQVFGVSVDASGVYVAGSTFGTLPGQTSAGSGDAFVRVYDASGTEVWTRQFGTSSFDQASGVSVDTSGLYVAGFTGGTLPGQTSSAGFDAFVVKFADAWPPLVSNVAATPNPAPVGTSIELTATVDDTASGASNVASASYTIDGNPPAEMSASDGAFDEPVEDVEATIPAFAEPDVHDVCVRGTDAAGNTASAECVMLAVFDPDAGFVTGSGWIDSPPGATTPDDPTDPDVTGRAVFAFVSGYKKGANVPDGNTHFQFQAADLKFQSDSYEWLVVSGTRAQYKGTGTINGAGTYKFMLTAIDGDQTGGDGLDKLRMKIWDATTGEVIYDNQAGKSDTGTAATALGAGNIVIHTG